MSAPDRHAWARPEPETVAPGVVRVALPLPSDALRAVNVYVLVSPDDLTLIDGGWALAESRGLLREALGGLGADLGDIRRFLVTHVHRDHYTQAVALRRETGARVAVGAGERESLGLIIDPPPGSALIAQIDGLRRAGAAPLADLIAGHVARADPGEGADPVEGNGDFEPPDDWLDDGRALSVAGRELTALETPGHTRGHLVFTADAAGPDERDLLFAGDHVLPHITPSIGFEPAARPGALGRFLDSLARLRRRPDRALLPAHGPAGPSVHARIDELLDHHGSRLDEIEALVAAGAATAAEVAGRLGWTRRASRLDDLEPFHRMLAVLETDAHLEVLDAHGRVTRSTVDGVVTHRPGG